MHIGQLHPWNFLLKIEQQERQTTQTTIFQKNYFSWHIICWKVMNFFWVHVSGKLTSGKQSSFQRKRNTWPICIYNTWGWQLFGLLLVRGLCSKELECERQSWLANWNCCAGLGVSCKKGEHWGIMNFKHYIWCVQGYSDLSKSKFHFVLFWPSIWSNIWRYKSRRH